MCSCDLTSNSCDAYCCCDWDCTDKTVGWLEKGWCKDVQDPVSQPLEPCLDVSDIRKYNIEQGEFSYAGPITQLLCVLVNQLPPANTFYIDITEVNDVENILATNENFGTNLFTSDTNAVKDYYSVKAGL